MANNLSQRWDIAWTDADRRPEAQEALLDTVLYSLVNDDLSDGQDGWSAKKEAADWIKGRAQDIALNGRMLEKVLRATISSANRKNEHPEVRRSARNASQTLWEFGWAAGGQTQESNNRRPDVLRLILLALVEEEDDPEDWRFRRTTVEWLGQKAKDLAENDSMAREVVQALTMRVAGDSDAFVRELAAEAIAANWDEGWNRKKDQQVKRQAVLNLVLVTLQTEDKAGDHAWVARLMAAKWLENESEEIATTDRLWEKSLDVLIYRVKVNEKHPDVRQQVREATLAIWESGWLSCRSPEERDNKRPEVLSYVLKALNDTGSDPEDSLFRRNTASWLRLKAPDLAENEGMAREALQALKERAVNDSDEYVKRYAEEAMVAIWDAGWPSGQVDYQPIGQHAVMDQVLETLTSSGKGEAGVWLVKRAAADWLGKKANKIAKGNRSVAQENRVVRILEALIDLADAYAGVHPQVSLSASTASKNIWRAGFLSAVSETDPSIAAISESGNGQNQQEIAAKTRLTSEQLRILRMVLQALGSCRDWEMRIAAADWLEKNTPLIARQEYQVFKKVADALASIRRDSTATAELKEHADLALRTLWVELEVEREAQLKVLRGEEVQDRQIDGLSAEVGGRTDEDKMAKAIWELSDRNTLGSREAVHQLVQIWVGWISQNQKPRLVELTAETIRYNKLAIPALIEVFNTPAKVGQDLALKRRIDRRIAKQLADMSDPLFFNDPENIENERRLKAEYQLILDDMRRLALPVCLVKLAEIASNGQGGSATKAAGELVADGNVTKQHLPSEEEKSRRQADAQEVEIREHLVRTLAYTSGREAVDSLAGLVVGKERERQENRDRLNEFYLEPSKERREQAAEILRGTVKETEQTLRTLKLLNILVFFVGVLVLAAGLAMFMLGDAGWERWLGFAAAFGGGTGIITLLIWDPLDRIQDSTANLVEVETAFTGFIWQLNLNQTLVQSRYINNGELNDRETTDTVRRIERAMEMTMNLVSAYTKDEEPRVVTRITTLEPARGKANNQVAIHGQHLLGDNSQSTGNNSRGGMVAVNHKPVIRREDDGPWDNDVVHITLPPDIKPGTNWISLFINGMETNALPFEVEP